MEDARTFKLASGCFGVSLVTGLLLGTAAISLYNLLRLTGISVCLLWAYRDSGQIYDGSKLSLVQAVLAFIGYAGMAFLVAAIVSILPGLAHHTF